MNLPRYIQLGIGGTIKLLLAGNRHDAALSMVKSDCLDEVNAQLTKDILTHWAIKAIENRNQQASIVPFKEDPDGGTRMCNEIMETFRRHQILYPSLGPIIKTAIRMGRVSLAAKVNLELFYLSSLIHIVVTQ